MSSDENKSQLPLSLALPYLPVYERLLMAQVSKYMRDALLPWTHFIFDCPINFRITDEILLNITSKSNGNMKSLTLNHCPGITDRALQTIAKRNPSLQELRLPECSSITAEGILSAIKSLPSPLKTLRIDGISPLDKQHLDLIYESMHLKTIKENWKPLFYHEGIGERPIDVDTCPRCREGKMVYDCPGEACENRACLDCIEKCIDCGVCLEDVSEFEERTACYDALCYACWWDLPKCGCCGLPYCGKHAHEGTSIDFFGFVCALCLFQNEWVLD